MHGKKEGLSVCTFYMVKKLKIRNGNICLLRREEKGDILADKFY